MWQKLHSGGSLAREKIGFQADALKLIRRELHPSKALIAFVGAPLTLFFYAVEGKHSGDLAQAKAGLSDGRFEGFCERLMEMLIENMMMQAESGADTIAIFDTCAGELTPDVYGKKVVPKLKMQMEKFKERFPDIPILYYSKKTDPEHWEMLRGLPISCLGVDWRHPMPKILNEWSHEWALQGNVDPDWLFLKTADLKKRLEHYFESISALPIEKKRGWICGLGHGVKPKTPEAHVRLFLELQKQYFPEIK